MNPSQKDKVHDFTMHCDDDFFETMSENIKDLEQYKYKIDPASKDYSDLDQFFRPLQKQIEEEL